MNFEKQQSKVAATDIKIDAIWAILCASKSRVMRDRCCALIARLEQEQDCLASGDGI